MPTPNWSAARSGLLGDTGAVDASAQLNQLLGAHGITVVYQGNQILTPFGSGGLNGRHPMYTADYSQPFVMSGTTIGRVGVPVTATGNGSDLIVSLYTDSGGVPGTLITRTRVPATWINELAAVTTLETTTFAIETMEYTGNPLALAQYNPFHLNIMIIANPWSYPTSGSGGPSTGPCSCYFGNYFIQMGGSSGATYFSNVYTIQFDDAGVLSQAVPQQSLPIATDGTSSAVVVVDPTTGDSTVVLAGGSTSAGVLTSAVYTAAFDGASGTTSAWTTQTSLPGTNQYSSMATYNGYVYVMGGANGTYPTNGVYYAQVQNGQINSWTAGPSLPSFFTGGLSTGFAYSAASNGFLFVFGGFNGVSLNTCAYAPINANGSLGAWIQGPNLPVVSAVFNGNPAIVANKYGIMANGNAQLFSLSVTVNGPDTAWRLSDFQLGGNYFAAVEISDGTFQYYGLYTAGGYTTGPVSLTPYVSVPLPTTGLTNGATYHVVMQQPSVSDQNNYLRLADDVEFSGHPTLLFRANGSGTWTPEATDTFVPISIYDGSTVGPAWHLLEDNGARISTIVHSTTPDGRVLGYLDAVVQPGPVLNANWQFTTGIPPWGVANGTIAQSNAFTHGNLPFSSRYTPTGGFTQAYTECEQMLVMQGHTYVGSAWVYSPTGYGSVSVILNWYTSGMAYISSSFGTVTSVAAGTWTFLTATGSPPASPFATFGTMGVYETGTPPNTAVLYVSAATYQDASGPMLSSVNMVDYADTWPTAVPWAPSGVTRLA